MTRHSALRRGVVALTYAVLSTGQPQAQLPQAGQPTFRAGIQAIEVDVRVFDRNGQFVTDLTRDDFEVFENGIAQQVQALYLVGGSSRGTVYGGVDVPPKPLPAPPAVTAVPAGPRHTWIFVFDLNHLTPGGGFDRAHKAVEEFVRDRFKEGDLAGVVAGARMVNNRLTSVRDELVAAVKSVKPLTDHRNRMTALTREWPRLRDEAEAIQIARGEREALQRAVVRASTDDPNGSGPVPPDLAIREKAERFRTDIQRATTETLAVMNGLASGLAKMPGSKTIVFLSDGFVTQQNETTLRNVVGQAASAGARVYAIDVRGLNRGANAGMGDQMVPDDPAGGPARFDMGEDGPNSLAIDTGGLMIRNENNLGRALDEIATDTNRYYVLGYQPTDTNFDGRYRPIEVRVKRKDVRVRARRGYLALEPSSFLVPQPIKPAVENVADQPKVEPPPVVPAPSPVSPAAIALPALTGVVVPVTTDAALPVRLRPDSSERIRELSGGLAETAGDLAAQGWSAYQRGDLEAAFGAFSKAAAKPDVRPWVLYALGMTEIGGGRPRDAIKSWERVRQAAPEFQPVYVDLAATYAHLTDLTPALAILRDAERRWPKDPEILNGIGVILVRRGALDDAIQVFARAVEAVPNDALAYLNLGRAYEMRYARSRRFVSSQDRWVANDADRLKAIEHFERYVKIGGPYVREAAEASSRLSWMKNEAMGQ